MSRAHHWQIGGATGSIGDPSGRSTERNALPAEELAANVASITAQVQRIVLNANAYLDRNVDWKGKGVDRGERKDVMVLNNLEWTKEITLLDFLKTVGKMSRVNFMLAREASVHPQLLVHGGLIAAVSKAASSRRLASHSLSSRTSFCRPTTSHICSASTAARSRSEARTNGAISLPASISSVGSWHKNAVRRKRQDGRQTQRRRRNERKLWPRRSVSCRLANRRQQRHSRLKMRSPCVTRPTA